MLHRNQRSQDRRSRTTHFGITRALLTKYFHKTEPNAPVSRTPPPPAAPRPANQFSSCPAAERVGRLAGTAAAATRYERNIHLYQSETSAREFTAVLCPCEIVKYQVMFRV